jgi:hypothetical protein
VEAECLVGGLRTGILLYMQRLRGMPQTPGEIAEALKFRRSTVQEILQDFDDHGILFRLEFPRVSLPPSIASRPPRGWSPTRRTVSSRRGEKPYRLNARGERIAELMNLLDKQLALPMGDQDRELVEDDVFMAKLKSFGFGEKDIKLAQDLGVLNHRKIKVVQVKHRTDYGVITQAAVVNVFKPQAGSGVVRHRYRIA